MLRQRLAIFGDYIRIFVYQYENKIKLLFFDTLEEIAKKANKANKFRCLTRRNAVYRIYSHDEDDSVSFYTFEYEHIKIWPDCSRNGQKSSPMDRYSDSCNCGCDPL